MDSKKIKQDVDFEQLCDIMQDKLKKYIEYKIKNIHNSEDVLQNVFLAAVNNRNELTEHPNPEGWLMNTAKNLILKEFYKNKGIAENEEELGCGSNELKSGKRVSKKPKIYDNGND